MGSHDFAYEIYFNPMNTLITQFLDEKNIKYKSYDNFIDYYHKKTVEIDYKGIKHNLSWAITWKNISFYLNGLV